MYRLLLILVASFPLVLGSTAANSTCKTTPSDAAWPSAEEWSTLNRTIGGTLIKTSPVASSCYAGNPFNSTVPCDTVEADWSYTTFHASLPESIDYPLYANNSCLPPGASGYTADKGCIVGALPQYVVNATLEEHISTAVAWATSYNIRIVVKGTGHDMNGRSSGAFALSIWTHNFNNISFNSAWPVPGSNMTADVIIAGSGNNWQRVYIAAEAVGKLIVGGGATTVGLGGFIQGGGHGPTSSHYGLAADQIYQVKVITTNGTLLVANPMQNQDLLWAIRGGGAGQYGVVTEYVLKAHPAPTSVSLGTLTLSTNGTDISSINAVWNALAVEVSSIPDLMDAGLAGEMEAISSVVSAGTTVTATHSFYGYNMTADNMTALLNPVIAKMRAQGDNLTLSVSWTEPVTYPTFTAFFTALNPSAGGAGALSMMSSRLLGREQLTNITQSQIVSYLKRALVAEKTGSGTYLIMGMQAGKGPANVPENLRGALQSSWRTAYVHAIALGVQFNLTATPMSALSAAAEWVNNNKETVWQDWAPDMGAYMNEANPYNPNFKTDYYGSSYDRLLSIKNKYDPTGSLFVLTGVGSDKWDYNLDTGKLCQV
ncbi:FAD-binding protein-1 [Coleophoma cylindrospora]|uniref:FAD-binding protein-1 n=1 Tax=Coleophoma cylindrospora TaxID=1849047 RepID=A0A3D8QTK3_9HELO|nr:FAD-binding protein-1 [Coleophoma cylindrospora]